MAHQRDALVGTGASVLSIDWTIDLPSYYDALPDHVAVQGNLDPVSLLTEWPQLKARTDDVLARVDGRLGHIFNLGHGIMPQAKIECVESLVGTVTNWKP